MPKYYIASGSLKVILDAADPMEAAKKSILRANGHAIDYYFYISEMGFRGKTGPIAETIIPYAYVIN